MESSTLEGLTRRLRELLNQKVPDLLLQAECGGGLELPSPLPWGFASVPSLYELADTAEKELYELNHEYDRKRLQYEQQQQQALERQEEQEQRRQEAEQKPQQEPQQAQEPQQEQQQQQVLEPPVADPQQERGALTEGSEEQGLLAGRAEEQGIQTEGLEEQGERELGQGSATQAGSLSPPQPQPQQQQQQQQEERQPAGAVPSYEASGASGRRGSHGDGGEGAGSRPGAVGDEEGARPEPTREARGGGEADEGGTLRQPQEERSKRSRNDDDKQVDDRTPRPALVPDPGPRPTYACTAFYDSLLESRTFRSPHCEGAVVEALGLQELYEGLAGSGLGAPPGREQLEALRALFREHINARWALEAVKQGVAAAKQGNYPDAHKCYTRALELDPRSAEAYVARGAAHANQRAFQEAEADLRHALDLDPGHRNAATYLDAVLRHVDEQRQQLEALEAERQQREKRRQPQMATQQQQRGMEVEMERRQPGGSELERREELTPTGAGRLEFRGSAHQGPLSAPSRLQRELGSLGRMGTGADAGVEERRAEGRRRDSDSSASGSTTSSSSGSDTPGQGAAGAVQRPANEDIKRALEVVLKARKHKRKSKHKKQKKKHKKSKRRRRD